MITSLEIENLRGIAKGSVSGLKHLTAIVGTNNSGKSTLLEALAVASSKGGLANWWWVACLRGWLGIDGFEQFFYRNSRMCKLAVLKDGQSRPSESFEFKLSDNAVIDNYLIEQARLFQLSDRRAYIEATSYLETGPSNEAAIIDDNGKATDPRLIQGRPVPVANVKFVDLNTKISLEDEWSKAIQKGHWFEKT